MESGRFITEKELGTRDQKVRNEVAAKLKLMNIRFKYDAKQAFTAGDPETAADLSVIQGAFKALIVRLKKNDWSGF